MSNNMPKTKFRSVNENAAHNVLDVMGVSYKLSYTADAVNFWVKDKLGKDRVITIPKSPVDAYTVETDLYKIAPDLI